MEAGLSRASGATSGVLNQAPVLDCPLEPKHTIRGGGGSSFGKLEMAGPASPLPVHHEGAPTRGGGFSFGRGPLH